MKIGNYYKIIPNYSFSSQKLIGELVDFKEPFYYFKFLKTGVIVPFSKIGVTYIPLTDLEVALL